MREAGKCTAQVRLRVTIWRVSGGSENDNSISTRARSEAAFNKSNELSSPSSFSFVQIPNYIEDAEYAEKKGEGALSLRSIKFGFYRSLVHYHRSFFSWPRFSRLAEEI